MNFKCSTVEDAFYIEFPVATSNTNLNENIKKWLLQTETTFVFDFRYMHIIDDKCLQPLVFFVKELKKYEKKLYIINASADFRKKVKLKGLDTLFKFIMNIAEIKDKPVANTAKKLDVDFVNPFITATIKTLTIQANTKLESGAPFLKNEKFHPEIAVVGVISIVSSAFNGSVSLSFPKTVFLKIYENMIGEKHAEITEEVQDACGELLNIIFGGAKAELNNISGFTIEKALPTVLSGEKVKVQQKKSLHVIVLPFKTEAGEFYLEVATEPA